MKISPWMVSAPAVAVATFSTGFARVVTVELLLMRVLFGSRGGTVVTSVDTNKQCYVKTARAGNLLYSARTSALPRHRGIHGRRTVRQLTLTPAVTRSGCDAHTV